MPLSKPKEIICYQGEFIEFIQKGRWEYVKRIRSRGVVIILALTPDNNILFVEQYRPPVARKVIELLAGLVSDQKANRCESVLKAAQRELLEETGYFAQKLTKIISGPVSAGLTSDTVTLVRAFDLFKMEAGGGDHTERIRVHEIPVMKIDPWLKKKAGQGFLIEPKIFSALYFLNRT